MHLWVREACLPRLARRAARLVNCVHAQPFADEERHRLLAFTPNRLVHDRPAFLHGRVSSSCRGGAPTSARLRDGGGVRAARKQELHDGHVAPGSSNEQRSVCLRTRSGMYCGSACSLGRACMHGAHYRRLRHCVQKGAVVQEHRAGVAVANICSLVQRGPALLHSGARDSVRPRSEAQQQKRPPEPFAPCLCAEPWRRGSTAAQQPARYPRRRAAACRRARFRLQCPSPAQGASPRATRCRS